MSRSIKILHLISGLGQGGAEQLLLDMSFEFKRNKHIKSSIISFSNETTLLPEFEKNAIDIAVLYKRKTFVDFIKMISEITSYIKKNQIDIIHAHMSHAMIVAAILKIRFPKLKVVFTPHNISLGNRLREGMIFLLKPFREIDILFAENMKQWFNKEKYQIIPNGIRVEDFEGEVEKFEKFTFIAVGNIKEAKNYPFLIDCANEMRENYDFQLLIVGSGKGKIKLEEQVTALKLEKHVQILGYQNNIAELLGKSHCLVIPSLWEGMPIVMLEAGASKLPIVSTKVGSISSILDNSCAYLTNLNEFSNNMENVIQNYEEAKVKAERFYVKVKENYTIEKTAVAFVNLYRGLVDS